MRDKMQFRHFHGPMLNFLLAIRLGAGRAIVATTDRSNCRELPSSCCMLAGQRAATDWVCATTTKGLKVTGPKAIHGAQAEGLRSTRSDSSSPFWWLGWGRL